MEALTTFVIILAILFLIWWLNLDRPVRSLSRSLSTLASAGEVKSAIVLADVVDDLKIDTLADVGKKLEALKALDL